jgi:hypothetical protein
VSRVRQAIIQAGVKAVKEFGYDACTASNVLTDKCYRKAFAASIDQALEDPKIARLPDVREEIRKLKQECE